MTDISRRDFLAAGLATPLASIVAKAARADAAQSEGIALNTAGVANGR